MFHRFAATVPAQGGRQESGGTNNQGGIDMQKGIIGKKIGMTQVFVKMATSFR